MNIYLIKISDLMEEYSRTWLMEYLPAQRREKVEQCGNDGDKDRCIAAGLLLRYAMARFDVPGNAAVAYASKGKPFLPGVPDFSFNISHSGDYAAIVCDRDPFTGELGIDVEHLRPYRENLAKRVCSDVEIAQLQKLEKEGREQELQCLFTRLWTQKEAAVKKTGIGIAGLIGYRAMLLSNVPDLKFQTLEVDEEYYLTVASDWTPFSAVVCRLTPRELIEDGAALSRG